MIKAGINSEFGKLETILIHEPGPEVENMTPATAERALYSDILNLPIARDEYAQFKGVLKNITKVIEVKELLVEILQDYAVRQDLIDRMGKYSGVVDVGGQLKDLSAEEITKTLIEGIPLPQVNLANFLSNDKFVVNPLHNMFFMRDASFTIGNTVYISSMARTVRKPEALMLEFLYKSALDQDSNVVYLNDEDQKGLTIEGGDVLVVSPEILVIGVGSRTTATAVDKLISKVSEHQALKYVIVQELPKEPESFIHLDMVFTLLSESECMAYKPLILGEGQFHTIMMKIDAGKIKSINYINNIPEGLKMCGFDYKPILCGGGDPMFQEREQWHSGANFFAFAPGKIIGYARNIHTAAALNKQGFEVISAMDIVNGIVSLDNYKKCLITIEGSELARGGGGPRCMTMPLFRS